MNDRFKFRVWDNKSKVYIESGSIDIRLGIFSTGNLLDAPRFTLEQCTGIQDIHQKYIYENDLLKEKYSGIWQVKWDDKEAAFYIYNRTRDFYLSPFIGEYEILGNANQNPELIDENCTGLFDKDNKLIYNQDVVTDGKDYGTIFWDDEHGRWGATGFLFMKSPSELKVVGNRKTMSESEYLKLGS